MLVKFLKMWYDKFKKVILMSNKVFNKKIPPNCGYCVHGYPSEYSNEILCKKRGVTNLRDSCRHYKYDPLKREPNKVKIADNYKPEDFSL